MAATLGGLDALVFTGGVGEHDAEIRASASDRLGFLGVKLDPRANASAIADVNISAPGSTAQILVVATNEALVLCREAMTVLKGLS